MLNKDKETFLSQINNDEFYSFNSEELNDIYSELTSNWDFNSDPPVFKSFIKTFPKTHFFLNKKDKNFLQSIYLKQNSKLRIIGFGGFRFIKDKKYTQYLCECSCGNKINVRGEIPFSCKKCNLGKDLSKIQSRLRTIKKLEQKIGDKHNRLTIKAVAPTRSKAKKNMVLVECDCGKTEPFPVVYVSLIPQGKKKRVVTKSCGCLGKELIREKHRNNALLSVGLTKNNLRIDSLSGYHPITKKQLANATCLACNSSVIIRLNDWRTERQKSCGCLMGNIGQRKSYIGRKHLFLEVLDDSKDRELNGGRKVRFVRCKCHACGRKDYEVRLDNIINQQQVSCGCIENRQRDNLIDLIINKEYSERLSSTYLVKIEFNKEKYLKIGIAFNFINRKSVAKVDGIPFVETIRKIEIERSKSWLLEQIILMRYKSFRMLHLSGIVSGGTEIFNQKINESEITKFFDLEYKKIKESTFRKRLIDLNCRFPTNWIKGNYN